MRIEVTHDRCEGHGLCELSAPEVYRLDEEGMVKVLFDEIPEALRTKAGAGARVCPVAALTPLE